MMSSMQQEAPTATCNELMREALILWQKVTGISPNAKRVTLGTWELSRTYDQIKEALDLDPSGITAILLIAYFANRHLSAQDVSLLSLLDEPDRISARLEHPRALLAILRQPAVLSAREHFIAGLRIALDRYDAGNRKDVSELLERHDDIAILRRDALRSIANLRVDQFLDGAPEAPDIVPVYNKTVHQWWNINSLLAAATSMPSGVSLNLIRDPTGYQSYFCFVIRNGGNLFVLSDVPKHAHPLQAQMSRKPERDLERRMAKNWFPYDLLNIAYDEESGELYIEEASKQKALVAYQNVALPLQAIADTGPEEIIWCSMMFELILERFWRQGFKAPALSYTGEMIKAETALIGLAQSANLPVPSYKPAAMKALTREDIASAGEDAVGNKYHEPNKWLEDRYGRQVTEEALNVLALPDASFALHHKTGVIDSLDEDPAGKKRGQRFGALTDWQQRDVLAGRMHIEKLNATSFGTRNQLEADRRFIARYNYATQIGALAEDEFESRKEEVLKWYLDRVRANMESILKWAGCKEIWIDDGVHPSFTSMHGDAGPCHHKEIKGGVHSDRRITHSLVEHYEIGSDNYGYRFSGKNMVGNFTPQGHYKCYLNGTKATWLVMVSPTNPAELALMANCSVEDLPDVLQHWILLAPYTGNSILDRVDPMIWRARNPWLELNLGIRFALSKRAMAKVLQNAALPDLPNLLPEGKC